MCNRLSNDLIQSIEMAYDQINRKDKMNSLKTLIKKDDNILFYFVT